MGLVVAKTMNSAQPQLGGTGAHRRRGNDVVHCERRGLGIRCARHYSRAAAGSTAILVRGRLHRRRVIGTASLARCRMADSTYLLYSSQTYVVRATCLLWLQICRMIPELFGSSSPKTTGESSESKARIPKDARCDDVGIFMRRFVHQCFFPYNAQCFRSVMGLARQGNDVNAGENEASKIFLSIEEKRTESYSSSRIQAAL